MHVEFFIRFKTNNALLITLVHNMLFASRSEFNSSRLTRAPEFNAARSLSRNSFLVRSRSPDLATVISISLPLALFLSYINPIIYKWNYSYKPMPTLSYYLQKRNSAKLLVFNPLSCSVYQINGLQLF